MKVLDLTSGEIKLIPEGRIVFTRKKKKPEKRLLLFSNLIIHLKKNT